MSQRPHDGSETGLPGAVTWPPDLSEEQYAPTSGRSIGNYRLLEQVGVGGMGVVYRAEQMAPVRRIVAVKLLKLGIDTPQLIARFQSERQSLAVLEHPNIARVYDAGATDTGRPYFVMEFVPGKPITDYCDGKQLATEHRLELFQQVCLAVQHAHYKGLLHRDLKPSNILITESESGEPHPKIIDFGIARALDDSGAADAARVTRNFELLGTPLYMSPEQRRGHDLDTRADVYALGVVLYELLTGALPFDTIPDDAARDPAKPSTRLSTLGAKADNTARARRTELTLLRRQLRGDLDQIAMKALAADRSDRYGTAAALAEDIRRHLNNEPIAARPQTLMYQATKFTRRNRVLVSATALALAAIVVGLIFASAGMIRARRALAREEVARRDAEGATRAAAAINEFLVDMLGSANPANAKGKQVLVRDVLDGAAGQISNRFVNQPRTAASIEAIIANTYHSLDLRDQALAHAERALKLRRESLGENHPDTLDAINSLASILAAAARNKEAEAMLRDLLSRRRAQAGPDAPATVTAELSLSLVLTSQRQFDEAIPLAQHVLDVKQRTLGEAHPETLTATHNLAGVKSERGDIDEAIKLYEIALAGRIKLLGEDHPSTILTRSNLATLMLRQNRATEAEPLLRQALVSNERVMGKDHHQTLATANSLAATLRLLNKLDEAETLSRDVLSRIQRSMPKDHPAQHIAIWSLALVLDARGKNEEALENYAKLCEITRGAAIPPATRGRYLAAYGETLVKLQRYAEAEAPLLEAQAAFKAAGLAGNGTSMRPVFKALAASYEKTGRAEEAAGLRAQATSLTTQPSSR